MKKLLIIFAVSILGMVACNEERVDVVKKENFNSIKIENQGSSGGVEVRFATGMADLIGLGCSGGGECGPCPAVCMIIRRRRPNRDDGYEPEASIANNTGTLLYNDNQLFLDVEELNGTINTGNSLTQVNDPIIISNEVSEELGFSSITINPGVYTIDYSNNPSGIVIFDNLILQPL